MEASLTTDVAVSRQTGKLEMVCEAVSPRPLQLLDPSSSAGVWLAGRDPPLLCKELFMLGAGGVFVQLANASSSLEPGAGSHPLSSGWGP